MKNGMLDVCSKKQRNRCGKLQLAFKSQNKNAAAPAARATTRSGARRRVRASEQAAPGGLRPRPARERQLAAAVF